MRERVKHEDKVLLFVKSNSGCTSNEISRELNIKPVNQVNHILSKLVESGSLQRDKHKGAYKYYFVPKHVQNDFMISKLESQREGKLKDITKKNTLIVISCTKRKIWDEGHWGHPYVPAIHAYTGKSITLFKNHVAEKEGFYCIILSAKYGFIELEHPIHYYNVTFSKSNTGPISDESLWNQVHYQSRYFGTEERKLCDFKHVLIKAGNRDSEENEKSYTNKVKKAFKNTEAEGNVEKLNKELWGQILRIVEPDLEHINGQ